MDAANFTPEKMYAHLLATGEEWADKDEAAALMEETRKPLLAELKLGSTEKSDAARETEALASQAYRDHLAAMVHARGEANRARVKYDSARVLAEARRTQESTRRAEMQFVQGGGAG